MLQNASGVLACPVGFLNATLQGLHCTALPEAAGRSWKRSMMSRTCPTGSLKCSKIPAKEMPMGNPHPAEPRTTRLSPAGGPPPGPVPMAVCSNLSIFSKCPFRPLPFAGPGLRTGNSPGRLQAIVTWLQPSASASFAGLPFKATQGEAVVLKSALRLQALSPTGLPAPHTPTHQHPDRTSQQEMARDIPTASHPAGPMSPGFPFNSLPPAMCPLHLVFGSGSFTGWVVWVHSCPRASSFTPTPVQRPPPPGSPP